MPIVNRVAALQQEIAQWRRDLHEHPELGFEEHRTAGMVAEKLKAFGCDEVVPAVGRTGVVGVIKGRRSGSGRVIGLRADMDALPISEISGVPHASRAAGKMHACGHDGHTAMLLGAARHLAETRNFDGTAVLIFQPAEEIGSGARAMVADGLMERFGIQEVYGMHNAPGLAIGQFAIRPGPQLAAVDEFGIEITGKGTHAARPHMGIDPVVVSAQLVMALQTIASRSIDPLHSVVVSTCVLRAGDAFNVIPHTASLRGTVRTLDEGVRNRTQARLTRIAESTAAMFDAEVEISYHRHCGVTVNEPGRTRFAAGVALDVAGAGNVDDAMAPIMGGEDFSDMLNVRPGAFIFLGNGDSPVCHHPAYDFNDEAIPFGVSYWVRLAETAMPA